jgi:probable DNA metabolism protein
MMRYRYDGTFEGFLCAVACCLEEGGEPSGFLRGHDNREDGLFADAIRETETVRETALRFRERFVPAVSKDAFGTVRYAFHSEAEGIELLLLRYIRLGLEVGRRLPRMLAQEPVCSVNRIARRVAHEAHKFKGFVRFREVEAGFLYAVIEPDADILPFIAPHFSQRVNDRPWIIHDLERSQAAVYNLSGWRLIRGVDLAAPPAYTPGEKACVSLWRGYFQHLAIPARRNPPLQRQHVPLRYRRNLVEFGK